jgi:putative FmdB family regulatory protein
MPTYDYVCGACGHAFEHFQSMSDRVLRTCPKCAQRKLVRQVGAGAGLIFKGSGFYQTDYKSSGSQRDGEGASKGSEAPKEAGAKAGAKGGDGAPAPKEAPAKEAKGGAESAPPAVGRATSGAPKEKPSTRAKKDS